MGMTSKDIARLRRGFQRAPEAMAKSARTALRNAANTWQRKVVLDRFRPFSDNKNDTNTLQSRTSMLRKSLGHRIEGETLSDLSLSVYSSGIKYARIQEYGGEVRPIKAKWLTIPLDAALGARGIPKRSGPRAYDDGFFFTSKKGSLIFAVSKVVGRGKNKRTDIVPLYVLKKSVTIPARFGLRQTWADLESERREKLQNALIAGLNKALGQGGADG